MKRASSLKSVPSLPHGESAAAPAELVFSLFGDVHICERDRDSPFSWTLRQTFPKTFPTPKSGETEGKGIFEVRPSRSALVVFYRLGSLEPDLCAEQTVFCLSLLFKKIKKETLFITLSKEALKKPSRHTCQTC